VNTRLPLPTKSLEIDEARGSAWIETETDLEIKSIKAKIIKSIQHVSFAYFKTFYFIIALFDNINKYSIILKVQNLP